MTPGNTSTASPQSWKDLADWALAIIANAGFGNWELESPQWQEAARDWTTEYQKFLSGGPADSTMAAGEALAAVLRKYQGRYHEAPWAAKDWQEGRQALEAWELAKAGAPVREEDKHSCQVFPPSSGPPGE